jgi:two-component system chemotaxis response regulator CheB
MIDVLVVEDSPVARDYLVFILGTDPSLRVIGTAPSGEAALEFLQDRRPDVILMDIHMPGIDGCETTRRIMSSNPVPVIVCTGSARFNEANTAMNALEAGALAVLKKPSGLGDPRADIDAGLVIRALKTMSEVKLVKRSVRTGRDGPAVDPPSVAASPLDLGPREVAAVAIGASTGGPPGVAEILTGLTPAFPAPVLLVQHITPGFADGLASWLTAASGLPVHVARGGEVPLPGHVYVAPDERHMLLGRQGRLVTSCDPPHDGLRPSVGPLFRSVAERHGRRSVGVLLTGMGKDGAEELRLMADRGALTIAQDEGSCVVFGMPGEAVRLGAAHFVLPPKQIVDVLRSTVQATSG